jgi:hypothetical protein
MQRRQQVGVGEVNDIGKSLSEADIGWVSFEDEQFKT